MSIKKLYGIRDNVAEAFHPPFVANNHPEAIRMLGNMVNAPNNLLNSNPSDFSLYYLADFDGHLGVIDYEPSNVTIVCHAVDVVRSENDNGR